MRLIVFLSLLIGLSACNAGATPTVAPASATPLTPTAAPTLTAASVTPPPPTASSRPTPIPLSEAGFFVMQANGLAIARHIAYVTSWEGLHLLDIADPTVPYQLGFYPAPYQSAAGVAVAGNRAYVMAIGLHIVDVSNPTAPVQLSFYQPPPAPISNPAVAGDTVFLAAGETGLIGVDVSDPTQPREISRVAAQEARWVTTAGSRAYLVDRDGVRILDISDPAHSQQVGLYRTNDAQRVAIAAGPGSPAATLAYVITTGTLYIVDVSEPSQPKELGAYAPPGGISSLTVDRDLVYLNMGIPNSNYTGGLSIVAVSDPASPRLVAQVAETADVWNGGSVQVAIDEAADQTAVYIISGFGGSLFAVPDAQILIAPKPGAGSRAGGRLQSLPVAGVTVESPRTYIDPDLDFRLNYDPSWQLEARTGADLNDGSGRTVVLQKDGYQFELKFQLKPAVAGECGGVLNQSDLPRFWKYPLGPLQVWRAKAEAGWVNSYNDDQISFIDILTPTELWDDADADGDIGLFSCSPQVNDYIFSLSYRLPVSVEDLKAGRFSPERLAEMDYILTSLTWE